MYTCVYLLYIFVHVTYYNMEIFCEKKFAIRLIYDTTITKYKVSLFYFKKFSQTFFEIFSYFPLLPPPPTGLVSQIFFLTLPGSTLNLFIGTCSRNYINQGVYCTRSWCILLTLVLLAYTLWFSRYIVPSYHADIVSWFQVNRPAQILYWRHADDNVQLDIRAVCLQKPISIIVVIINHLPWATLLIQSKYLTFFSSYMYWPFPLTIFNGFFEKNNWTLCLWENKQKERSVKIELKDFGVEERSYGMYFFLKLSVTSFV